ncbi:NapC/NirT family cytochrome c [Geothrix sp. 21YS21S-2]|uniref:NapC/NirT family cytochrome c n=1 Tax=Geothrix sp. 21YS21S-2 TaxID=3068893 RepID=UPI0027BA6051|nr:NapC/NirT family cytochrome c [Geothrix sp. 21YS21S-2]
MDWRDRLTVWFRHAFFYGDNWVSICAGILTTATGFTLLWSWFRELASPHSALPYVGILLFVLLPLLFLVGLVLIPFGMWLKYKKMAKAGEAPEVMPKVDLTTRHIRHVLTVVAVATVLNIALLGVATVRGVEYMDSSKFCGLTCHTPMIMEYRAFVDSPHSRVGCAQCHIGPGADSFMRAKLAGVRQLFGVVFNNYHRPIPSPVESLRPAKETCESCHWPQKFHGNKILVKTHYGDDIANTPAITVLMLKIGGRSGEANTGIHGRHIDTSERITYSAGDERRQVIPRVIYRDDKGQSVEYVSTDTKLTPEQLAKLPQRGMDCVDCHNRPTHAFESPEWAMDRRIQEGLVSRDIPFIHKKGVEVLKVEYRDQNDATARIPKALVDFYQSNYPEVYKEKKALIEAAAVAVKDAYLRNVSPEMKLTWGTHPNHIGHQDGGCFRCHDGSHVSKDGRTIAGDCDTCHTILAQDDPNPKILQDLGTK